MTFQGLQGRLARPMAASLIAMALAAPLSAQTASGNGGDGDQPASGDAATSQGVASAPGAVGNAGR